MINDARNRDVHYGLRSLVCMMAVLAAGAARGRGMVWVEPGTPVAPIVVAADDPTGSVLDAAEDLAGYVERISGRRPEVVQGAPDPLPERAVWVGIQPAVRTVFPDLDLEFQQPEEILQLLGRQIVLPLLRPRSVTFGLHEVKGRLQ